MHMYYFKGPLIRINNKVKSDNVQQCETFQRKASPISLEKIFTIFMFLLVAGFVSLCLLIIEMFHVKLCKKIVL